MPGLVPGQSCPPAMRPMLGTTFFQPLPMVSRADSFLGTTKPEWTRRTRVPSTTGEPVGFYFDESEGPSLAWCHACEQVRLQATGTNPYVT